MRKVMGSGWYHLHWPHESFGISPERDVTAHGGLCDGEWCDLMFWKDPSGCCIRPAWDLGNIVRPAVTLQSEGKTPQLWDTADVWTVMGFRVLLQASGGGRGWPRLLLWGWSVLLEEIRSHTTEMRLHGSPSCSVDSDAGLASEANRSFCWVFAAFITEVFILEYTLCWNYWLFCLFSKLTLQKWKLPHFYFNLKLPAECLIQLGFHCMFAKWKNE